MVSNSIENSILQAIAEYDGSVTLNNPFEELLSMGEIVDRLSIVNFKLFNLKNQVMDTNATSEFKSWASGEDVRLVMERARLKKCIDIKIMAIIKKLLEDVDSGGFNAEVKRYGENKL